MESNAKFIFIILNKTFKKNELKFVIVYNEHRITNAYVPSAFSTIPQVHMGIAKC